VLDALVSGRHAESLREYFGAPAYAELSLLAAAANRARQPRGAKVLILPGIMGSKIGGPIRSANRHRHPATQLARPRSGRATCEDVGILP